MTLSRIQIGLGWLVIAAILGASHWVFAMQRPGSGPHPGGPELPRLQQLVRQLDLTEAQKAAIQGFLDSARTQLDALRTDTALTREQRMNQAQQISQQTRDQIRSVLTPDQQLKADELRQQAEQRIEAQREKMEGQLLQRLANQLDLSESQRDTIELHLQDQKIQLEILMDNPSLTPSQKFEQMQVIRQQTQDKINSVLTSDQQAQLDQLRGRLGNRRGDRPRRGPRRGPGGEAEQVPDLSL